MTCADLKSKWHRLEARYAKVKRAVERLRLDVMLAKNDYELCDRAYPVGKSRCACSVAGHIGSRKKSKRRRRR